MILLQVQRYSRGHVQCLWPEFCEGKHLSSYQPFTQSCTLDRTLKIFTQKRKIYRQMRNIFNVRICVMGKWDDWASLHFQFLFSGDNLNIYLPPTIRLDPCLSRVLDEIILLNGYVEWEYEMRPPERLPPDPWLHLPGHLHPRICVQCCQPRGPVTQGDEVSILLVLSSSCFSLKNCDTFFSSE